MSATYGYVRVSSIDQNEEPVEIPTEMLITLYEIQETFRIVTAQSLPGLRSAICFLGHRKVKGIVYYPSCLLRHDKALMEHAFQGMQRRI